MNSLIVFCLMPLACTGQRADAKKWLSASSSEDMLATLLLAANPAAARTALESRRGDVVMKKAPPRSIERRFVTGDTVKVIQGDSKGETGKVIEINRKKKNGPFVKLEGMNTVTKHQKPQREGESGKIIIRENWIHGSNVVPLPSGGEVDDEE